MKLAGHCCALIASVTMMAGFAHAQSPKFRSRVDFHRSTDFGTLVFNHGALSSAQNRQITRYEPVLDGTENSFQRQNTYCFVFNHISEDSVGISVKYTVLVEKQQISGEVLKQEISRSYIISSDIGSSSAPDFCISNLRNTKKMRISTKHEIDKSFDYEFLVSL